MTRRRQPADFTDVPAVALQYDLAIHGPGGEGVQRWKNAALDWLNANPGRTLPAGDALGVLQTAVRLLADEWKIPL